MSYFGTSGSGEVSSVNGKLGNVTLKASDVEAVANILNTCGGVQIGRLTERPNIAENNVLYIVTDKTPNEFYRFNLATNTWDKIGSTESSEITGDILALNVKFTNTASGLVSINVQDAIVEIDKLISDHKAIIDKNSSDITNLKLEVGSGKVKTSSGDTLDYLGAKVDGATIQVITDKLIAKTLDGLNSTITELNYSSGVKSNIQAQIDSLSRVGNFTGSVNTKADLVTLVNPSVSDLVIVIADETQGDVSTLYMYDGASWVFVGEFKVEMRDFTTNPINLATEVTGVLSAIHLDASVVLDSEIDLVLLNKFSEVSGNLLYNGQAIGGGNDGTVHGSVRQMYESNVTAPKTVKLNLPKLTDFSGVPLEVLSLESGQKNVIETVSTFTSGDKGKYEDNEYVSFSGNLKMKSNYDYDITIRSGNTYTFALTELDVFKNWTLNKTIDKI